MPKLLATYNDSELLALLSKEDNSAYTAIFDRYWERLLVVGVNKLDKDLPLAQDIVQEIFADLWARRGEVLSINNLSAYLATALKYKVIDARLKRARMKEYSRTKSNMSDLDYSSLNQLDFKELKDRLAKLVKDLPDKCQLVYRLCKESHYSQKEVAKVLNISEKTVESHLSRAVKLLRAGLNISNVLPPLLVIIQSLKP